MYTEYHLKVDINTSNLQDNTDGYICTVHTRMWEGYVEEGWSRCGPEVRIKSPLWLLGKLRVFCTIYVFYIKWSIWIFYHSFSKCKWNVTHVSLTFLSTPGKYFLHHMAIYSHGISRTEMMGKKTRAIRAMWQTHHWKQINSMVFFFFFAGKV